MSELVVEAASSAADQRAEAFGLRAPSRWLRWAEVRSVGEAASLLAAAPWLARQPRGSGRTVVLIPGFAADDRFMAPLRWYLRRLGHDAQPWGLGTNRGDPEAEAERLIARVDALPEGPVDLVGWSLGGVVARLTARARPDRVGRIVTLGTPVEGGPKYTAVGDLFAQRRKIDLEAVEAAAHAINSEGLTADLTVIYSEADGIVGAEAAVDRYNAHARHVRLRYASHVGLIANPKVFVEVARALSSRPE